MRRIAAPAALAAAILAAALAHAGGAPRPDHKKIMAVLESERSFAAMAKSYGVRHAFLTWLADSAMIFQPLPMNAKETWTKRQETRAALMWEPDFAEVSFAGDLGVTSGPWRYYPPNSGGIPMGWGRFVSVWRPEANGEWRVVADIGITHGMQARSVGSSSLSLGPPHTAPPPGAKPATPATLDAALTAATRSRGTAKGYAQLATRDLRFYRDGAWFYDRPADAYAWLDSIPGRIEFAPGGGGGSTSSDLAYTWGTAVRYAPKAATPADTSVYLHVWRREAGTWKLSLAVLNPSR